MAKETNEKILFASEKKKYYRENQTVLQRNFSTCILGCKTFCNNCFMETLFSLLLRSEVSADHYLVKQSGKVSFEKIFLDSPPHPNIL